MPRCLIRLSVGLPYSAIGYACYIPPTTLMRDLVEANPFARHALEGRVDQDRRRGFSFLVERVLDLWEVVEGARVSKPRVTPSSGAFVRAKRPGRRAG
jgi:hypothetical protein